MRNIYRFIILLDSPIYNELKVINTYDWIKATTVSKTNRAIRGIKITIKIISLDPGSPEVTKAVNKWPATIIAASWTDKVIGRIIFLTISINTTKGINTIGVPKGIRWARNALRSKTIELEITSHRGNAILKVNDRWAEEVKT